MLKIHDADVQWVVTEDYAEAELLERRLIEWHRACTGIAPLAVGWNAKKGSPREAGEQWARGSVDSGVRTLKSPLHRVRVHRKGRVERHSSSSSS